MSYEEVLKIMALPKHITENGQPLKRLPLHMTYPFKERFTLVTEASEDYTFLLKAEQSAKRRLKLTLHLQEQETSLGLLRVDFNGAPHKNPEEVNQHVPEAFRPYAGAWLRETHVHYAVEGYRTLAWAVPAAASDFPVRELRSVLEVSGAFRSFCNYIAVSTILDITTEGPSLFDGEH